MDREELDIYLELAREAETAGDYRTADKIDGMIRTANLRNLPPWLQTFLMDTKDAATRAKALELIRRNIHRLGRATFFSNLGYARRLRRNRGRRTEELSYEGLSSALRGEGTAAKAGFVNKFLTTYRIQFERLNERFKEEVDQILPGLQRAIDREKAAIRSAHPTYSEEQIEQAALRSSSVTMYVSRLATPAARVYQATQSQLKSAAEAAMELIRTDPRTRAGLGLGGPGTFTTADLTHEHIAQVIASRFPKLVGVNSEISGEMLRRFLANGSVQGRFFIGGRIEPGYFFKTFGGARKMPPAIALIIPAFLAGKIPFPPGPGPKPGPDVPPVGGGVVKETNELAADRIPAGQYRTPEPVLQAYITAKGFKGVFTQGKTTKKELYNMALVEKGEKFANDLIQYAIKNYGLKGVGLTETDSPIG